MERWTWNDVAANHMNSKVGNVHGPVQNISTVMLGRVYFECSGTFLFAEPSRMSFCCGNRWNTDISELQCMRSGCEHVWTHVLSTSRGTCVPTWYFLGYFSFFSFFFFCPSTWRTEFCSSKRARTMKAVNECQTKTSSIKENTDSNI